MTSFAYREYALRQVFQVWWRRLRGLHPATGKELPGLDPNRGELAKLRRIGLTGGDDEPGIAIIEALEIESFPGLWRGVAATLRIPATDPQIDFVAVAAATLAQVRTEKSGEDTARLLGEPSDHPLFAEARFRRLIRTDAAADLLDQGRRIVAALGGAAPVGELGASLVLWSRDAKIRRRWAFSYYHLRDAPADEPPAAPAESGASA